jgi:recombination protein RecA
MAPPFKTVEFDIMYGQGISKMGELVDLGVKAGLVEKSGSWFSYGDQRIGQGRENAKNFLSENTDLSDQLEREIMAESGILSEAALTDPARNADQVDDGAEDKA